MASARLVVVVTRWVVVGRAVVVVRAVVAVVVGAGVLGGELAELLRWLNASPSTTATVRTAPKRTLAATRTIVPAVPKPAWRAGRRATFLLTA
jgi:hypothetical protein